MSGRELFTRHGANPILQAGEWPYPVNAVFSPAAARVDGEIVLLARVEDRPQACHPQAVARSAPSVPALQAKILQRDGVALHRREAPCAR